MDTICQKNKNWISYVFPWLPFFVMYSVGKLTICDGITIIGVIYCLVKTKGKVNISYNREYLYFFMMITVLHIISLLRHPENESWLNNYLFCSFFISVAIMVFPELIDEESFIKSYMLAGIVALAGLYYQAFQVYALHQAVTSIVVFPNLVRNYDQINIFGIMRPMGFFSEPQAYISFMSPLYILMLSKKNIKYAILIAISFLLSTSSTGIVVVAIISFIWGIKYVEKIQYKIVFLVVFVAIMYAFLQMNIFDFALQKLSNIDVTDNVRITNGFEMFYSLSFVDRMLGIGGGNIEHYWGIRMSNATYANSFARTLIEYGYIGTTALCGVVLKLFFVKDETVKLLLIYTIIVMFSQTIMFNAWQLLTFVVMYIYIRKVKNETEDRKYV